MEAERKPPDGSGNQAHVPDGTEPVWTYRGYQLRASEFTTAMVHLFSSSCPRSRFGTPVGRSASTAARPPPSAISHPAPAPPDAGWLGGPALRRRSGPSPASLSTG